jgi:hypothetical protein
MGTFKILFQIFEVLSEMSFFLIEKVHLVVFP